MVSEKLIVQFSLPGELVVDPFMGSGSVGVAALKHRRKFQGCDVVEDAVFLIEKRLSEVLAERYKQLPLDEVQ